MRLWSFVQTPILGKQILNGLFVSVGARGDGAFEGAGVAIGASMSEHESNECRDTARTI